MEHVAEAARWTLEGQVLDEQGQPVAGALVRLDERRAHSDDQGRFAFDAVAPGLARLWAHRAALRSEIALVNMRADRAPVALAMARGMTAEVLVLHGGAPVAGARLLIDDDEVAVSDAQGRAVVLGIAGHFELIDVVAEGYAASCLSLTLAPDPDTASAHTVALVRGAALAGIVCGPDGVARPGAWVHVSSSGWGDDLEADARGAWRIEAVAAGRYELCAVVGPAASPRLTVELDGRTPRTDIVLAVARGARIAGRVVDRSGAPIARPHMVAVRIEAHAAEQSQPAEVTGDADGHYEAAGLPPGTYDVFAYAGDQASPRSRVVLGDDDAVLELVVEPAAMAGRVVDPDDRPLAGVALNLHAGSVLRGDVTDAEGRFDLGALPPGDYEVTAEIGPGSAQHAAQLAVRTGASDARLVLGLGRITGRVRLGGAALPYFGVLLTTCPQFPWIGRPLGVRDPEGRFALPAAADGTWGLVLAGPGSSLHTITGLDVGPGSEIDLGEIDLPRGARVTGGVYDAAGAPVGGARVAIGDLGPLRSSDSPLERWFRGTHETTTDAAGAFVFDGIALFRPPGAVPAVLAATHGTTAASHALSGGDEHLALTLADTGGLDGVVEGDARLAIAIHAHRHAEPGVLRVATLASDGRFHFDELIPGDYSIRMIVRPGAPVAAGVRATVIANQRTAVQLVMP